MKDVKFSDLYENLYISYLLYEYCRRAQIHLKAFPSWFTSNDSRYIFAKEEFRSEDATNVSLSLLGTELVEGDTCGIRTWYKRIAGCP